jgi:hypothetical protein
MRFLADHGIRQERQGHAKFFVGHGVIPFPHGGLRAPERFLATRQRRLPPRRLAFRDGVCVLRKRARAKEREQRGRENE